MTTMDVHLGVDAVKVTYHIQHYTLISSKNTMVNLHLAQKTTKTLLEEAVEGQEKKDEKLRLLNSRQ